MALDTAATTAGIAALAVPQYGNASVDITILDIDELDPHIEQRDLPVFFPAPGEWKGGAAGSPSTETTFGTPSTRFWLVHQTFKYVFIQAIVGEGRDINDYYLPASKNADALWTALAALNVSGVDVENINISPIGIVNDPVGTEFVGTIFEIAVKEKINP